MQFPSERHALIRAHEWIRLFPGRRLCGQNMEGVWWDDERDSTHLRVWEDVRRDIKNAWIKKFRTDIKQRTDPTKENRRHG